MPSGPGTATLMTAVSNTQQGKKAMVESTMVQMAMLRIVSTVIDDADLLQIARETDAQPNHPSTLPTRSSFPPVNRSAKVVSTAL